MHTVTIGMLKFLPLRGLYWFTGAFVLPIVMCINRYPVKAIYSYNRRRLGRSALKAAWHSYLSHYRMAQMVLDRFAAYAGKKFKFDIEGNEAFARLEEQPGGFIMLSSHVGNTEMVGYSMGSKKKPMASLVYGGESQAVMKNRIRILAEQGIELIPVEDGLGHIYAMNDVLQRGYILGMPADRIFSSQKSVDVMFLGAKAPFPLGPFVTAVQMQVPAVAIFMMKTAVHRYRLHVRPIEVEGIVTMPRRRAMEALTREFARQLEEIVTRYPDQWFNYFDFWHEMTPGMPQPPASPQTPYTAN